MTVTIIVGGEVWFQGIDVTDLQVLDGVLTIIKKEIVGRGEIETYTVNMYQVDQILATSY